MTYLNDCEKSSVVQDNIPVGIVECVAERGLALPHGSELLIVVGFISGAQQAGKDSNQGRQRQRGSECANIRILIIKAKKICKNIHSRLLGLNAAKRCSTRFCLVGPTKV